MVDSWLYPFTADVLSTNKYWQRDEFPSSALSRRVDHPSGYKGVIASLHYVRAGNCLVPWLLNELVRFLAITHWRVGSLNGHSTFVGVSTKFAKQVLNGATPISLHHYTRVLLSRFCLTSRERWWIIVKFIQHCLLRHLDTQLYLLRHLDTQLCQRQHHKPVNVCNIKHYQWKNITVANRFVREIKQNMQLK